MARSLPDRLPAVATLQLGRLVRLIQYWYTGTPEPEDWPPHDFQPAEEFEACLAAVTGAEELHILARDVLHWAFDSDKDYHRRIIRHPLCDLGTALMVYWRGSPGQFLRFASPNDVPGADRNRYDTLREIEERVAAGAYSHARFPFDPRNDEGFNITPDRMDLQASGRDVPAVMYRPVTGQTEPEVIIETDPQATGFARYYLSHLIPGDKPTATGRFEIQLRNGMDQTLATGYVNSPGDELVIDGHVVPPAVIAAALTLPVGAGHYANTEGVWVTDFGRPTQPLHIDRAHVAEVLLLTGQGMLHDQAAAGERRLRAVVEWYAETPAAEKARLLLNVKKVSRPGED